MSKIKVLPTDIANKIAAGEVVQRPASVVKELLENSLDAGSSKITVEIIGGGRDLIRIEDNGSGMSKDDAILAFERHATSKISSAEDLDSIRSFGFRGEALPSIAAVSITELVTKTTDSISGTLVRLEGGVVKEVKETGTPVGTSIEIQRLFFNTPARRKFLKTVATEAGHISNIVSQEAIAQPEISFKLIHNGQIVFNAPATKDPLERVSSLLGRELSQDLIRLDFKTSLFEVTGFLAPPSHTRSNRAGQSIFVNRRYITNRTIMHALYAGYHTLLPINRHPIAVIFIAIDPALVDVNVHPAKSEVRFRQEREVHDGIEQAVREALSGTDLIPRVVEAPAPGIGEPGREARIKGAMETYFSRQTEQGSRGAEERRSRGTGDQGPFSESLGFSPDTGGIPFSQQVSMFSRTRLYPLAQIYNTYIVAQDEEGISIIDQHAAAERVAYEKLMKEAGQAQVNSQLLLIPITLETDYAQAAILIENRDIFNSFGFQIEEFGQKTFLLRAVPAIAEKRNPKELIFDLLHDLQTMEKTKDIQAIKEKMLILVACHSAIRAGDKLSPPEIEALISQLSQTTLPYTCPHGRPTVIKLSLNELEKRFKRIS
ncbi:MAG: DNA mismatch repair endonuclease MutL [bacterium]|nr:DNA mismatch repair endonuclease MutL [bacterium]